MNEANTSEGESFRGCGRVTTGWLTVKAKAMKDRQGRERREGGKVKKSARTTV